MRDDPPRRTVLSAKAFAGTIRSRAARCPICCRRRRPNTARGRRSNSAIVRSATPSWKRWSRSRPRRSCAPATAANHSVALFLGNSPDHPVNFFGALKAGARIVHLSPLDGEIALSHKLSDSGARVLVTSNLAALLPTALKFLEKGLLDRLIVCEDDDWGAVGNPQTPIPDNPAIVTFRTFIDGVTQAGAMAAASRRRRRAAAIHRRHHRPAEGRDAQPRQSDRRRCRSTTSGAGRRAPSATPIERVICVLPLFHIFALTVVLLRCAPARQSDLAAPALRRRSRDARHRGQARHRVSRRADHVDRDRRACPISTSATCRRW